MNEHPGPVPQKFALIVVNYGSAHLLAKNLAGLELAGLGGRIVVVDNYSSGPEREAVQKLATSGDWTLLALEGNLGFGAGVNAGARAAFADGAVAMAVLNPDAHIETTDLMHLVSAVLADSMLMVSPVMKTSGGSIWFDGMELYTDTGTVASRRRRVPPAGPHEPWLSGACFAVSRALWEHVGGFDEDYFLYWEDVDLCRRVADSGARLAVLDHVAAVHDAGGTQVRIGGAGTKSETFYYYNIRNRLLYAAKHMHGKQLRRWILATPRVSCEILLAGGRRVLLSSTVPLRAYVRGIVDGCRMLADIRYRPLISASVNKAVAGTIETTHTHTERARP